MTCLKTYIPLEADEKANVTSESRHVSSSCSPFVVNVVLKLKVSNT